MNTQPEEVKQVVSFNRLDLVKKYNESSKMFRLIGLKFVSLDGSMYHMYNSHNLPVHFNPITLHMVWSYGVGGTLLLHNLHCMLV